LPANRKYGAVHPGWHWGPFTARIPFYHTRPEWPDFVQGLIVLSATSMALVPLLQAAFGLTFYEAIACAMIHLILFATGPLLFGDPFAPGYITPVLPITISFVLGSYSDYSERFQMMTALSLDFTIIMLFFGFTGLGKRFVTWLPKALKGGIILGASIASFKRVFFDDIDTFMKQPMATTAAIAVCLIFAFSKPFAAYSARHPLIRKVASMGLLPGFLIAAIIGYAAGEVTFDITWGFLIPPVGDLWAKVSPFAIGWPPIEMFIAGIPLALIGYTISFGDFITGEEVVKDAAKDRPDEKLDFNIDRIHYSVSIRNIVMSITSPFFSSQGVLWTGMHVIVVQRWRQGREAMDSLFGGISAFYLFGLPLILFCLPVITLLAPFMSIALSISLVLTGFACAYVAMAIPETPEERGVALLTGTSLVLFEPWLGLLIGVITTFFIVGFKKIEHDAHTEQPRENIEEASMHDGVAI